MDELSKDELLLLKNKIDCLLSLQNTKKESKNKNIEIFYESISDFLYKTNKTTKIPFSVFKRGNKYKNFKDKCHDLFKYKELLFTNIRGNKKVIDIKFYNLCNSLLSEWLIYCEIPICLNTIINNLDKIPSLVDKNFPQYIENNLNSLIIK